MQLRHNIHLAYCTNIHRGQSWAETLNTLKQFTLPVRDRIAEGQPYAIGLRLGERAARELSESETLRNFRKWLDKNNCYIFTINGFPYGTFHGGRVKELAYIPDWTTRERFHYTSRLFDLLGELVPAGIEGSVSTVPGSFKPLIKTAAQVKKMRENLWLAVDHIDRVSQRTGKTLHLGLEPEPCCYLETSEETLRFIEDMRTDRPGDERLQKYLGVNYDCCHLAVEYEEPSAAIQRFTSNNIRISKLHFSSAMKVVPTEQARSALQAFVDPVYFHQVVARKQDGTLIRYLDLDEALATHNADEQEWRIHFHIPLHAKPTSVFDTTADHLLGVMDLLAKNPSLCSHIEMETYTWEVLPPELKNLDVVGQLSAEYHWTLGRMKERGLF